VPVPAADWTWCYWSPHTVWNFLAPPLVLPRASPKFRFAGAMFDMGDYAAMIRFGRLRPQMGFAVGTIRKHRTYFS
jgi:hypothetical protein